ncbi:MAG: hemolysin family protein [Desulfotomaculaceae bacterium]|nr:hemolysin family protein [Desulfotomaculaceae bacterium]
MEVNWTGIFLILVLVLINAFFAASEIAVITARRLKIEKLKDDGNKSAQVLIGLMDNPGLFLATIQVGITLAGFLASATAAVGLSATIAHIFREIGIPTGISNTLGVLIITIIISYITLVFGELAPKRLAMQWSEKIALTAARPINLIAKVTTPLTRFLTFSTNIVVRLLGGNPQHREKEITEEEIRLYITEHRTLPEEEKRLIEAVFDFGDQVVRQVMVPRTEIFYMSADDSIKEALEKACKVRYSTFPVYKTDYENVVGIVRIHNLACEFLEDQECKVEDIMSPTLFVPETKHTVALLKELSQKKLDMAVVVDEYGGIAGIVTFEDLVNEIIGDVIEDQSNILKTSDGQWLVEGDTPIEDIIDALGLKTITPDAEYETIAGFMLEKLGHLPAEGETVPWEGYNFQVRKMGTRRIKKVLISSTPGKNS